MDADRSTEANPNREIPLAGTGDTEAAEDTDSPGQGNSFSTWPSWDSNEKSEATRIRLLSSFSVSNPTFPLRYDYFCNPRNYSSERLSDSPKGSQPDSSLGHLTPSPESFPSTILPISRASSLSHTARKKKQRQPKGSTIVSSSGDNIHHFLNDLETIKSHPQITPHTE